jgi:uncharacterized protein
VTAETVELLVAVRLARHVRAFGVAASPPRVAMLVEALRAGSRPLDIDYLLTVGRICLCSNAEDLEKYDRAMAGPSREVLTLRHSTANQGTPGSGLEQTGSVHGSTTAGLAPSPGVRRVSAVQPAREVDDILDHLVAALERRPWRTPIRRRTTTLRGRPDVPRTFRRMLARAGEPVPPVLSEHGTRSTRTAIVIDVSRSMAAYLTPAISFAQAVTMRRSGTEVFTIGTGLTHVTPVMRDRDRALARSAIEGLVPDWHGGTRLGQGLEQFNRRLASAGGRLDVVVVISDAFEAGDCRPLAMQAARLSRMSRRVVWCQPHLLAGGGLPEVRGARAVAPIVDVTAPAGDPQDFLSLVDVVAYLTSRASKIQRSRLPRTTVAPGGRS